MLGEKRRGLGRKFVSNGNCAISDEFTTKNAFISFSTIVLDWTLRPFLKNFLEFLHLIFLLTFFQITSQSFPKISPLIFIFVFFETFIICIMIIVNRFPNVNISVHNFFANSSKVSLNYWFHFLRGCAFLLFCEVNFNSVPQIT